MKFFLFPFVVISLAILNKIHCVRITNGDHSIKQRNVEKTRKLIQSKGNMLQNKTEIRNNFKNPDLSIEENKEELKQNLNTVADENNNVTISHNVKDDSGATLSAGSKGVIMNIYGSGSRNPLPSENMPTLKDESSKAADVLSHMEREENLNGRHSDEDKNLENERKDEETDMETRNVLNQLSEEKKDEKEKNAKLEKQIETEKEKEELDEEAAEDEEETLKHKDEQKEQKIRNSIHALERDMKKEEELIKDDEREMKEIQREEGLNLKSIQEDENEKIEDLKQHEELMEESSPTNSAVTLGKDASHESHNHCDENLPTSPSNQSNTLSIETKNNLNLTNEKNENNAGNVMLCVEMTHCQTQRLNSNLWKKNMGK